MTRYELAERIGAGGMAEIFRGTAVAAGGFEKPVAIKRILPHLSQDERFVELLIAEAHILSQLRHRNIVQIFDVGLGPDGQYFLVMEFVDGADLGKIQTSLEDENRALPIELGLYIGAEMCDALEHAHIAPGPDGQPMRLVHRDVSPSNVLISRSGEVKLTDFGIAKRTEEVTGHGGVRGKFAYISPEQAVNAHVDARSDVFSAGIVLYELLLGRRLFSQMPDFDALRAVRNADVPRPLQVDPGLDPRLDQLLRTALAKNPENRFASAGEMSRALRELRYSMPASDGDPAQELGGMVEGVKQPVDERKKAAPDDDFEDATVVLDSDRSRFSLSMDDDDDSHLSYMDARQVVNSFEEEVTRAVYDPLLPSRRLHDEDSQEFDEDETHQSDGLDSLRTPESEGGEEATVVGTLKGMRKKRSASTDEERPTSLIATPIAPSSSPDRDELSGELDSASPVRDSNGLDIPTIDRALGGHDSEPANAADSRDAMPSLATGASVVSTAGSALPPSVAVVNPYPSVYSQMAMANAAHERRKKMMIGILVGCGVLLLLLVVGLSGDAGEAASEDRVEIDAASVPIDAGVPADAPVDAAPPKQKTTKKKTTKKKPRRKKPNRKKTRRKKPNRKKATTKKKTTK